MGALAPIGATEFTAGPILYGVGSGGFLDSPHLFPLQVHSAMVASLLSPTVVNSLLITVVVGGCKQRVIRDSDAQFLLLSALKVLCMRKYTKSVYEHKCGIRLGDNHSNKGSRKALMLYYNARIQMFLSPSE